MTELSPREIQIVRAISRGLTNKEIAGELHATPEAIKQSSARIRAKLGRRNRVQLTLWWIETGQAKYPAETLLK